MSDKASQQRSFLERWSRRKRGLGDDGEPADLDEAAQHEAARAGLEADANCASSSASTVSEGNEAASRDSEPPLKDFAEFDFEKLDYDSDYTQFMGNDVTSEARHKALRKLWVSNPVLANMDGLDDYCEDYTDAAVCLPKGMMKTAYQYGRGFLNDDEVAEWEALGREPEGDAEAASDDSSVATSENGEAGENAEIAAADLTGGDALDDAADAPSGAGAACGAAVKQEEAQMLAEYEDENSSRESEAKS